MDPTALVVLTTLGAEEDARRLVTALVRERVVACGTILSGARSIYRWEGELSEETEVVVLLKTDGFTHRGWSLAAGGLFGVGMLTKPTFAAYVPCSV